MIGRILSSIVRKAGYTPKRYEPRSQAPGMVLHQYLKDDGSFDYERYREVQQEGNRRKINNVWVLEDNVVFLSNYIRALVPEVKFGICHGTRRGKEQEWFRKHLGCDVIGTEISDTAALFPHTIQWDFHEVKPEWLDSVDFIYSNSFDHSYDPEKCLNAWMSCVRKGGVCILEHSSLHEIRGVTQLDPFGAELFVMPYLIATWGSGRFGVRQILPAPAKSDMVGQQHFIVIQRF